MPTESFCPYIEIPATEKSRTIRVKKAWLNDERIETLSDGLKGLFQEPHSPRVSWATGGVKVEPGSKLRLIVVKDRGRVVEICPILGHSDIPTDVFRAVLFLGYLMSFTVAAQARVLQKRGEDTDPPDPFDNEATVGWIADNMRLDSGSQFLARFFARFWDWIGKTGL